MYDESFYDWKIIPRFYMKNKFDNNCRFYFNLDYKLKNKFLLPVHNYFFWNPHLYLNYFLWYKIFFKNNLYFVMELCDENDKLKN